MSGFSQNKSSTRVGIIDLGTNSVRFAIYELNRDQLPHCLFKKKIMLRPGQGVFKFQKLKTSVVKRILSSFSAYADVCRQFQTKDVLAVATSAFREAKNAAQVTKKIKAKTGINVKVISGSREAELIAKGILQFETIPGGQLCFIDIGGGSTEISLIHDGKLKLSISIPLGSSRVNEVFFDGYQKLSVPQKHAAAAKARAEIRKVLAKKPIAALRANGGRVAFGSSGTIRALGRMLDPRARWLLAPQLKRRRVLRLQFSQRSLGQLIAKMTPMTRSELKKISGMEEKRVDMILAGAVLLDEVLKFVAVKEVTTTNFALRDGLLVEAQKSVFSRRKRS